MRPHGLVGRESRLNASGVVQQRNPVQEMK
jgi:hypothetical protein